MVTKRFKFQLIEISASEGRYDRFGVNLAASSDGIDVKKRTFKVKPSFMYSSTHVLLYSTHITPILCLDKVINVNLIRFRMSVITCLGFGQLGCR